MNIRDLIRNKNEEYLELINQKNKIDKEAKTSHNKIREKIEDIEDESDRSVSRLKREYNKKIEELQDNRQKDIESYRKNAVQRIQRIETDHSARKSAIINTYNESIAEINSQYEIKIQKLNRLCKRELERLEEDFNSDKYVIENRSALSKELNVLHENIANREKDRQLNEARRNINKILNQIDDELDSHKANLNRTLQKNYVMKSDLAINHNLCELTERYLDAKREEKDISNSSFTSNNFSLGSSKQDLQSITELYERERQEAANYYKEQMERETKKRDEALILAENKKNSDLEALKVFFKEIDEIKRDIERVSSSTTDSLEKQRELLLEEQKRVIKKVRNEADDAVDELARKRMIVTRESKDKLAQLDQQIDDLLKETKSEIDGIINKISDYEIGNKDFNRVVSLPEQICIGEFITKLGDCELSRILYGQKQIGYKTPIMLDVRNKGNIIINAPNSNEIEETLYRVVCGLTMKYMEEFPLGSLKVHFINKSSHRWISKFKNPFCAKDDPTCRGLITDSRNIHSELEFIDRHINDNLMPHIEGNIDDLFDLYKIDTSQSFNLFVIRRGFSDIVENGNVETLSLLDNLMGEWGMKSGIRFIIVNDYVENEHISHQAQHLLGEILSKGINIDLCEESVFFNNSPISISCIKEENAESFIERNCSEMADILKNQQGDKVYYEDIGFGEIALNKYSPTLEIPVGKCGQHRFILPLSCGGEGVQNQGCFVMGRPRRGKSSFFHSLIINGSMKYSPEDLQFWILDFKDGASSSVYENSRIPHIKLLSQNNKIGDALCLLKLLDVEMRRRLNLIKTAGKKAGGVIFNSLSSYNEYVDNHSNAGEHLSRIVVLMDEAQRMFKDDNDNGIDDDDTIKGITKLIGDVTTLAPVAGIHLVIIVQDLNEQGKSYLLVDNFVNKVGARIAFSSPPAALENSGMGNEFTEIKEQIDSLKTGETYARYMNGVKPQKVKMAFCDENNFQTYFAKISERYGDYENNLLVIGDNSPLLLDNVSKIENADYNSLIRKPEAYLIDGNMRYSFVYGEDCYSLKPAQTLVSSDSQSTTVIAGENARMSSSVFASILCGVSELPEKMIYLCKGKDAIIDTTLSNLRDNEKINIYKEKEIDVMIETLYEEYLRRKLMLEDEIYADEPPIFAFIHNVSGKDKIKTGLEFGKLLEKNNKDERLIQSTDIIDRSNPYQIGDGDEDDYQDPDDFMEDYSSHNDIDEDEMDSMSRNVLNYGNNISNEYVVEKDYTTAENNDFYDEVMSRIGDKPIADVIEEMCMDGYVVNMHFVLSVTNLSNNSLSTIFTEARNQIIFNSAPQNIYYKKSGYVIEDMLRQTQNADKKATQSMAVSCIDGMLSKVRPVLH